MKTILRSSPILAAAALLLAWGCKASAQTSASYQITRSVISNGGGRCASASYDLTGTLGQPSPTEASESESYNLGSGFWGGMVRLFSVAIESISYSLAEGVRITWQSIADVTYTIYYTDALNLSTIWNDLSPVTGTGGLMEWLDDGSETGTHPSDLLKRFYRLGGEPGG
ncbi:hypothetical protein HQ563_18135 [bacterium]|nr:hypothetical protein [bacterium]